MKPLSNNVIFRKQNSYASQKSSLIMTIEPEEEFIVEHIGAKVENVKPGDRIVIAARKAKSINSDDRFMISEDDILAVYTK
tara:strand:+ start:697 stop:939 length:243 start_codon:yes stop_codon:yes gene_type:complete